MGKSLSSNSARGRSEKQQEEALETCSAGRAAAHPYKLQPGTSERGRYVQEGRVLTLDVAADINRGLLSYVEVIRAFYEILAELLST